MFSVNFNVCQFAFVVYLLHGIHFQFCCNVVLFYRISATSFGAFLQNRDRHVYSAGTTRCRDRAH